MTLRLLPEPTDEELDPIGARREAESCKYPNGEDTTENIGLPRHHDYHPFEFPE
jgi:hypothetical protein